MMPFTSLVSLLKNGLAALFLLFAVCLPLAQANDHGGGAAGPEPMRFTVNVGGAASGGKYLQIEMVFETAHPEAAQTIVTLKPRVQHALILLLTGEQPDHLRTREGKRELMEKIIEEVNKVIEETEKTGVKEVLFTSFIIQ
jgi:flagellar FliL protein